MKFSPRTVTLLWDVHAWAGVIASLVLAMMFFAGSLSLFHREIEVWQDPPEARGDLAALDAALAAVDPRTLDGKYVAVEPPGDSVSRGVLHLPERDRQLVDPVSGRVHAQRSKVGQLFFYLHFLWHDSFPQGMQIAGVLGVVLLLVLVTGLVIHLKDLRRQAFRFRPWLRPRFVWSDLHKVLGVWGLPFQTMIAFTGAVICLGAVLTPRMAGSAFDGDVARGDRELSGNPPAVTVPDTPAPTLPITALVARALEEVPGMEATYIGIDRWGRAGARATVWGELPRGRFHPAANVVLRADDGGVVSRFVEESPPARSTMYVVYGIHFATYGGLGLKLLYFVLGLGGWLTILSGNWIWIERRALRRGGFGNAVLARLTLGAGGGIVFAAAATLWINRLMAPSAARPAWEVWGFFAIWALVALVALAAPARRRSWAVLLAAAGLAFAAIPVLSLLTSPAHLGNGGGIAGWRVAGVDLGAAGLGALFLVAARAAWRRGATAVPGASPADGDAP